MRALLQRSIAVRIAVVLAAAACILGLVHAAEAGGDPSLRRATLLPDGLLGLFGLPAAEPAAAAERESAVSAKPLASHRPRRIWAAARGRPLRIGFDHARLRLRTASRRATDRQATAAFRLVPPPARTALVSIYNDRSLRSGDAVVLQDGVHVFRDRGTWPHRPQDFIRLQFVAGLDWHLRRTLQPFDNNPPTRWTSIMVPPV